MKLDIDFDNIGKAEYESRKIANEMEAIIAENNRQYPGSQEEWEILWETAKERIFQKDGFALDIN